MESVIKFDRKQLALYRRADPACTYAAVRWPLGQGRGRWGEFPLVVVREHFRQEGYVVLASEPRLVGEGFILVSYPGYRRIRHAAYTQMARLLDTTINALDALNEQADLAKRNATGNTSGGDPDLFCYRLDTTERFFVEVKHHDRLTAKQQATFEVIRQYWDVKLVRIAGV